MAFPCSVLEQCLLLFVGYTYTLHVRTHHLGPSTPLYGPFPPNGPIPPAMLRPVHNSVNHLVAFLHIEPNNGCKWGTPIQLRLMSTFSSSLCLGLDPSPPLQLRTFSASKSCFRAICVAPYCTLALVHCLQGRGVYVHGNPKACLWYCALPPKHHRYQHAFPTALAMLERR